MIPFLSAIVGSLAGLARRCPNCKRVQILAASKKHSIVKCKFCGAHIPAPGAKGVG